MFRSFRRFIRRLFRKKRPAQDWQVVFAKMFDAPKGVAAMPWLMRLREWIASAFARPQDAELRAAYQRMIEVTDAFVESNSQAETAARDGTA